MDSNHILSLLGLCLRGGHLTVGEEPVEGVIRSKDARVLLLASDAAENTRRRCRHFAEAGNCLWLPLPFTKAELGRAVGRTSVALAAVTDIGLAANVVRRLAQLDPATCGKAAEAMELKAKRAAQRKAEQDAHEKNLRAGKRRPKAPAPPPEPPAAAPTPAPRAAASSNKPGSRAASSRKPAYRPRTASKTDPRSGTTSKPAAASGSPARRNGPAPDGTARPRPAGRFGSRPGSAGPHAGPRTGPHAGPRTGGPHGSRPVKGKRPKPKAKTNPYAHSHPVKKGKGSFRKKDA